MAVDVLKQIWPEWQIEEKPLGKGSYGAVYKAVRRDHNVESFAAIKVISIPSDPYELDVLRSDGLDANATKTYLQSVMNDFIGEIQLMESLKGVQNIVSVEDYKVIEKNDEIGWDIFIRMELLTPFNSYICNKTLTEDEVIKLGCDICTALEICSKRNIIHRDIKPENIFVNDFGHFKLGDFGIARKLENLTSGLSQKGTFYYMAPEVASCNDYDARVDIYSLGIVLYRMLNGNRIPFLDTEDQLMNPSDRWTAVDRRLRGEKLPAPCEASPAMADLILRACAYDPNMRFSSADEMKQALLRVANGTYYLPAATDLDWAAPAYTSSVYSGKTTPLYSAPEVSVQKPEQTSNSFEAVSKKKNPLPAVLAAAFVTVILVGAGIFTVSKLIDRGGKSEPDKAPIETAPVQELQNLQDSPQPSEAFEKTPTVPENHNSINISIPASAPVTSIEPLTLSGFDGDLSNYEKLRFSGAKASSELVYGGEQFYASYAVDGNLNSTWQEGASGLGIGETLTLSFSDEVSVNIIEIYPGFISSDYVFENNGRPKSLQFDFSDGSSCTYDFEDQRGGVVLKLSKTVVTDSICITILDAYNAPWEDTAIAEVAAYR